VGYADRAERPRDVVADDQGGHRDEAGEPDEGRQERRRDRFPAARPAIGRGDRVTTVVPTATTRLNAPEFRVSEFDF
jgi:hypothetical protein